MAKPVRPVATVLWIQIVGGLQALSPIGSAAYESMTILSHRVSISHVISRNRNVRYQYTIEKTGHHAS